MVQYYLICIFFMIIFIASVLDLLGKPIPVFLTVIGVMIKAVELLYYKPELITEHFFAALMAAIILFGVAFFGNLGGADCLIGTLVVFQMGVYGIIALIVSFILAMPYALYMRIRNKEQEYPFIPYIAVAVFLVSIYILKTGGHL